MLYPKNISTLARHCSGMKSDANDVCETGIVFSTSALRMRIVTFQSRLYTLRNIRGLSLSSSCRYDQSLYVRYLDTCIEVVR